MRLLGLEINRSAPAVRAYGTAFEARSLASSVAATRVPAVKAAAPMLPPKRTDGTLGGVGWIMVEIGSNAAHVGLARCYLGPVEVP